MLPPKWCDTFFSYYPLFKEKASEFGATGASTQDQDHLGVLIGPSIKNPIVGETRDELVSFAPAAVVLLPPPLLSQFLDVPGLQTGEPSMSIANCRGLLDNNVWRATDGSTGGNVRMPLTSLQINRWMESLSPFGKGEENALIWLLTFNVQSNVLVVGVFLVLDKTNVCPCIGDLHVGYM